jgi:hypothetical protein
MERKEGKAKREEKHWRGGGGIEQNSKDRNRRKGRKHAGLGRKESIKKRRDISSSKEKERTGISEER